LKPKANANVLPQRTCQSSSSNQKEAPFIPSKVYFANIDNIKFRGIVLQIDDLFERADFESLIDKGDSVAVKIHTGDEYNNWSMRPAFIRRVVENVKKLGGTPFVSDATQLYKIAKFTSAGLIEAAATNGFTYATLGCPVVCADGPSVTFADPMNVEDTTLQIPDASRLKEIEIASAFVNADAMIVCARVCPSPDRRSMLKHIGMGCASKRGKARIHEVTKPKIDLDRCTGCGICIDYCAWDAVQIVEGKARIDYGKCHGCTICCEVCRFGGDGGLAGGTLLQKNGGVQKQIGIVDSATALIRQKKEKIGYLSFLVDYVDDCENWHKRPIFPDIGILASKDPVAIDAAAYDLIAKAPFLPWSEADMLPPNADKINSWPVNAPNMYDWDVQLEEAERLGLGTRKYQLIEIEGAGSKYDYHGLGGFVHQKARSKV